MVTSEVKSSALIYLFASMGGIVFLLITFFYNYRPQPDAGHIFFVALFFTGFIYMLLYVVFGEMRKKAINVIIDNDTITKNSFSGLGFKTTYNYDSIDGFITAILPDREYLYLVKGSKYVVTLSSSYLESYEELKEEILNSAIKNLGEVKYSVFTDLKGMFY